MLTWQWVIQDALWVDLEWGQAQEYIWHTSMEMVMQGGWGEEVAVTHAHKAREGGKQWEGGNGSLGGE